MNGGVAVAIFSGKARLAGVMGWPVAHSLSPRLHGYWLDHYGIDGVYVPLAVHPSNLQQAIEALPRLGFCGLNVTVPHKETVMQYLDHVDETARRIGAVNTISFDENGQSHGTNTDAFGFIENILYSLPDWDFSKGPVVVLGAGGAARAICVALLDAGVPEIRLLNRTLQRAETLRGDIGGGISVLDWQSRNDGLSDVAMVVNTTTLGMTGQPPLDMDLRNLPVQACVTDIVYAPLQTDLLIEATERGNLVVDGIGMLLHQARPGFEAWFGRAPDVTAKQRTHVLEAIG